MLPLNVTISSVHETYLVEIMMELKYQAFGYQQKYKSKSKSKFTSSKDVCKIKSLLQKTVHLPWNRQKFAEVMTSLLATTPLF